MAARLQDGIAVMAWPGARPVAALWVCAAVAAMPALASAQRRPEAAGRGASSPAEAPHAGPASAPVPLLPLDSDSYARVKEGSGCTVRPTLSFNGQDLNLINRWVWIELCEAGDPAELAVNLDACAQPEGARVRRHIQFDNFEKFDEKELAQLREHGYVIIFRDFTLPRPAAMRSSEFILTGKACQQP